MRGEELNSLTPCLLPSPKIESSYLCQVQLSDPYCSGAIKRAYIGYDCLCLGLVKRTGESQRQIDLCFFDLHIRLYVLKERDSIMATTNSPTVTRFIIRWHLPRMNTTTKETLNIIQHLKVRIGYLNIKNPVGHKSVITMPIVLHALIPSKVYIPFTIKKACDVNLIYLTNHTLIISEN